jgi:hypothetical protein
MCSRTESTQFQISHSLFWGFQFTIEKSQLLTYANEDELHQFICKVGKEKLISFLGNYNLLELRDKAHLTNFHIHGTTMNTIVNSSELIYVCGHC